MSLQNDQLARLACREMLHAAEQERLARRALRQRRAARLARRANGLARRAATWTEQQVALAR
jgi:hypothetical protein